MKQIDDIRRDNLKRLADKVGGIAALAGALKRSDAQVSQWIRGPPHSVTGKPRGMKSVTARWIETTTELPPGWLDQNHEASPLTARDAQFIARIAQEVAHYNVPEHIRLSVLALIQSSPPRDDATQASGETGKAA